MQLNYSSQNVTALGAQGFKKIARGGGGSGFFPLCSVSSGLVQPLGPFRCFTRVHVHSVLALLAAHSAAPVELALALGDASDACGVVPPPAAHHLAAIRPAGHLVAHATGRAQGAWGRKRERVSVSLLHLVQTLPPPGPATVSSGKMGHLPSATETSGTTALAAVKSPICHSTCRSTVPRRGS